MGLEELAGEMPWYFINNALEHFDFIFRRVLRPVEHRPSPRNPRKALRRRARRGTRSVLGVLDPEEDPAGAQ